MRNAVAWLPVVETGFCSAPALHYYGIFRNSQYCTAIEYLPGMQISPVNRWLNKRIPDPGSVPLRQQDAMLIIAGGYVIAGGTTAAVRMINLSQGWRVKVHLLIKRVYEPASPNDGLRVLVDRLWPRGMKKEQVQAAMWLKEVAPSTELRKWYAHDQSKWEEFKTRYFAELDARTEVLNNLLDQAANGSLTLLFSARDTECNQAVALREYLLSRFKKRVR
ncbi:MAG TPA: DUF488 domain-containing protein [Anaerolineae bacterium]